MCWGKSVTICHPSKNLEQLPKRFFVICASVLYDLNFPTMSAILSADDLNDFISPGVACLKPIETLPLHKPEIRNVSQFPIAHSEALR